MASIIKVDTIQTAAGGTPTAADLGLNTTGSVLQVVQYVNAENIVITGTTLTATQLTGSITPTSASNKILAIVHGGFDTNTSGRGAAATLFRNGTLNLASLGASNFFAYEIGYNSRIQSSFGFSFLDSPNTTASTTYTLYARSTDSGTIEIPGNYMNKGLTLMEIAG